MQLAGCLPGKPLFGFTKYSQIYAVVRDFNMHFGVSIHIAPHSLRAGGATYYKMQNMSLEEIALIGRWSDFSTAKSYIDVVYAILPGTIEVDKRVGPRELDALEAFLAPPTTE